MSYANIIPDLGNQFILTAQLALRKDSLLFCLTDQVKIEKSTQAEEINFSLLSKENQFNLRKISAGAKQGFVWQDWRANTLSNYVHGSGGLHFADPVG